MADDRTLQTGEIAVVGRPDGFIVSNFRRLTIAKKLMLGFSSLLVLLVIISAFALANLSRLTSLNKSILLTDLPVIRASEEMIDLILAEELYARRYLVFRTADVLKVFLEKEELFAQQLARIKAVPETHKFPTEKIALLHEQYVDLLIEGTESATEASTTMPEEVEERIKTDQERLVATIQAMAEIAQQDQNEKTGKTAAIGTIAFKAAAVLCALGLILSVIAATIITRNIAKAIKELRLAISMIAKGNFDHKLDIRNNDELGDLGAAFVAMAGRLKRLEEMSLDTSPLTRLPGGMTIENVVNARINAGAEIAFCLMDIDNFKAFNDTYGYAKGNELIQATADIVAEAVAGNGSEDDFIGHIGGDDFVVITSPDCADGICQSVVDLFDRTIPDFYSAEDRARGHILGENRQGEEVSFPLATISIAVVTNRDAEILNHIQFGETAADIKERAKAVAGSVFLMDQRKCERGTRRDR